MTRPKRLLITGGAVLAGLVVVLGITAVLTVQTDWFRNFVREKIISATQEATGGRVEIGSFSFEVSHLRAVITDFVIHGKEPASEAPFVSAARVQLDLRLFTSLKHILDVTYLGVDKPQANIIVQADGTSNIPTPKDRKPASDTTPLETVVSLAVDHFNLSNGSVTANSRKQAFDIKGENLRADLWFNPVAQSYSGQLGLEPLYIVRGRNTPVRFRAQLPVTLDKDRIDLRAASITTPTSSLSINGSLEDLRDPKLTGRINGHISLADVRNAGDLPISLGVKNTPDRIDIDANASGSGDTIQLTGLKVSLGQSTIVASGPLKSTQGGNLEFRTSLAIGELGRLLKLDARPEGSVQLNGTAKLDAANNYDVNGNLSARNLAFVQGARRFRDIGIESVVHLDPHRLNLQGLRLNALGGAFLGNVSLEDFRFYQVDGQLRGFDIQNATRALGQKPLPYAGVVSGAVKASGDAKATGAQSIVASANLSINPGRGGIPMSGKINANYNGAADTVIVQNSFVALPHTRLALNGSLNNRINIALTSRDLNDLLAAAPSPSTPKIELNGGEARFNGTVSGALTSPAIIGRLDVDRFSVEGRAFQSLAADLTASATAASIRNGSLSRGPMRAAFSATLGMRNWSPLPQSPLAADLSLSGGDIADVVVLAGQPPAGYSGALTANAHIDGTVGNPRGNADVQASTGTLYGEPFDRAEIHVAMLDRKVTIPAAYVASGPQRVELSGEFEHPPDGFKTGQVRAHVKASQVDLAAIRTLQRSRPNLGGQVQLEADLAGNLTSEKEGPQFLLTGLTATGSAKNILADGQNYGDATLAARTNGQTVNYTVSSNFAGSNSQVTGRTQLAKDYPTVLDANLSRLPIQRVLAFAKQNTIPARGDLSGTAHFSGTLTNPEGSAELDLANAVVYEEPLNYVRLRGTYLAQAVQLDQLQIETGAGRLDLTGRFDHPQNDLKNGNLQFKVDSTRIDLAQLRNAQKVRPGLGGFVQISGDGTGAMRAGEPAFSLRSLNANVEARNLTVQRNALGNVTLKANTVTGNEVRFALDSDLAGSAIHGEGNARLTPDYPVDARLTFNNVTYARLRNALGPTTGEVQPFDVVTDGSITLNGPVMKTGELNGTLQLTRLNLDTTARPGMPSPVSIRNQGPVRLVMQKGALRIESAHLAGSQTDFQATGTASLPQQTMNASVNTTLNLAILESFSRDIVSSGGITANATIGGSFSKPQINGLLELRNASLNYSAVPNGIANANGAIVFNGTNATIRSLTAETGGGKLTASGFVGYADGARFGLQVKASSVRYRVQQGVSAVASADVRLTGSEASSVVSGSVTVERLNYAPQSDIGAILSRSATPVQSESVPSPLLENMKLDIRVRTAPSLDVQASLAQNLQANADLRLRGTAARPGMLGRVNVSEGQLVFFGSTYNVNTGTIAFYDPLRIVPVLNISLETQAKGVNVNLNVTGPIDNMKLSYTSDPPLQFQEIVTLLASGKTPTSDPTLLANQPTQPSQSFEQMGQSALVSKALADPVANRLQRVFGVTQLKIDPAFTSGSAIPTARLTFQQQISSNVTFTYTSALDDPNSTIIRAEWAFNPQYSAVVTRDQNGLVSVLLFYKRQFR